MKPDVQKTSWITLAAVILAVAGYLIYHYGYMVYREYEYHAYYDDIHGLQRSSPVLIDGVRVGEVSDINISTDNRKVAVTISINKKIKVPKGSIALLASKGLLGERMILLQDGNGPGFYTHNDVITGMYDTSVMDMKDQIEPMIENAKYILGTADKTFTDFNKKIANGLVGETQQNIYSIEKSLGSYRNQAAAMQGYAQGFLNTLGQFRRQSDKLARDGSNLDKTIKDAERATAEYAAMPLDKTVDSFKNTINAAGRKAADVEQADGVKKAMDNKKQYNEIAKELEDTDSSMRKLHRDPPGFSLIGGK